MPSPYEQMFEQHAAPQHEAHFGVPVVFIRGANESAQFTAPWEHHEYEVFGHEGFPVKVKSRDWILPAAKLVVDSATVEPRAGDRIRDVDTGDVWEITSLSSSIPAVELLPGNYRYRVHVKRIEIG